MPPLKLVTYVLRRGGTTSKRSHVGIMNNDGGLLPLKDVRIPLFAGIKSMLDLIRLGDNGVSALEEYSAQTSTKLLAPERYKLLAPIPLPHRNVFCVGKNYADHVKEVAATGGGSSVPSLSGSHDAPVFFTKAPQCVIGPGAAIEAHESLTNNLDWEVELAVVIGMEGRNIIREKAMSHVYGYLIANDVTARDLQRRHGQWFKGKTLDTSLPMGPWLVPARHPREESLQLDLKLWVNGQLKQSGNTRDLIHNVPAIIASLSEGFTLFPGDIIMTGTPAGVGFAMNPPERLVKGDVVRLSITGLGELINTVTRSSRVE